jgi:hypothetical protein
MYRFIVLTLWLLTTSAAAADDLIGTWSAPSLSRPDTPIIIGLRPDGVATEQIGDYRGAGTWTREGLTAHIDWGKGWFGILQPSGDGTYRLRTWKEGSSRDGPPDDDKPAERIPTPDA